MEWFSRTLNGAVDDGFIKPYKIKRGEVRINHLLYADDMLIFSNGSKDSLKNLLSLVADFCSFSGQSLNSSKSKIIFSKNINARRKSDILSITGFVEASLPISYLGIPLFRGRVKQAYFIPLLQRIQDKVSSWSRNFLSMGGRVALVNSVLSAIGIHNMMVLPVPSTILGRIASIIANFVWDKGDSKRRHWAGWNKMIRPKSCGGLGIKDPSSIQLALHGKLAWRFIRQETLWSRFAKARFKEDEHGSVIWNCFRHLLDGIREDCYWVFGNGESSVDSICATLGWPFPPHLYQVKVKDVCMDQVAWGCLIDLWPIAVREKMRYVQLSNSPDEVHWMKASDGILTTKSFWSSFQTQWPPVVWANRIWNSYIPPKVACFMWRVFHQALPTDDNYSRIGVSIVSRCVCCSSHSQETMHHLLFESEWASQLWAFLGNLFRKPVVRCIDSMINSWFRDENDSISSHMGSILAATGLWELWKARNTLVFEGSRIDWMCLTLRWPMRVAHLISSQQGAVMDQQLMQFLRILPP